MGKVKRIFSSYDVVGKCQFERKIIVLFEGMKRKSLDAGILGVTRR